MSATTAKSSTTSSTTPSTTTTSSIVAPNTPPVSFIAANASVMPNTSSTTTSSIPTSSVPSNLIRNMTSHLTTQLTSAASATTTSTNLTGSFASKSDAVGGGGEGVSMLASLENEVAKATTMAATTDPNFDEELKTTMIALPGLPAVEAALAGWISLSVLLLMASCCVMIVAWYLHLKFAKEWSMPQAIFISWFVAGAEYCLQVPANRIGHQQARLTAATLRAIAEVVILVAFLVFNVVILREPLRMNHIFGFFVVFGGVILVLFGPFPNVIMHLPAWESGGPAGDDRNQTEVQRLEEDPLPV